MSTEWAFITTKLVYTRVRDNFRKVIPLVNYSLPHNEGRAKNNPFGLAGRAEILIGHLYNLIQSWSNFFGGPIVGNCAENGQWPAAILSSVRVNPPTK